VSVNRDGDWKWKVNKVVEWRSCENVLVLSIVLVGVVTIGGNGVGKVLVELVPVVKKVRFVWWV